MKMSIFEIFWILQDNIFKIPKFSRNTFAKNLLFVLWSSNLLTIQPRLISKWFNLAWKLTGKECLNQCFEGGKCPSCGDHGFCCRNWNGNRKLEIPSANGDCPAKAIQAALINHHRCITPTRGWFVIAWIFKVFKA